MQLSLSKTCTGAFCPSHPPLLCTLPLTYGHTGLMHFFFSASMSSGSDVVFSRAVDSLPSVLGDALRGSQLDVPTL